MIKSRMTDTKEKISSIAKGLAPHAIGTSLKADHYHDILASADGRPVDFLELHAENYMVDGGVHHFFLERIADHYPLSLHGVGLSLGSADGIDADHLDRFAALVQRYKPALISDHLAWSVESGIYLNDLLPLPYTEESLEIVCCNIATVQDRIGRKILVENPSAYLQFETSILREQDFLIALCERTGCGLLLDINNIVVSSHNMKFNAKKFAMDIPADFIGEIHLAGHVIRLIDGVELRIDDHGSPVSDEVLTLYETVISRTGAKPTVVEWDNEYPDFHGLAKEADRARTTMQKALTEKALDQAQQQHTPLAQPKTGAAL